MGRSTEGDVGQGCPTYNLIRRDTPLACPLPNQRNPHHQRNPGSILVLFFRNSVTFSQLAGLHSGRHFPRTRFSVSKTIQKVLIVLLSLIATGTAVAQNLQVFDLDTSAFPTMKAKFYAFDANGQQQNPTTTDIAITENGTARTVLSISCPEAAQPKTLSSVLVMDVSGSMGSGSGSVINLDLAKAAADEWTKNLLLGPNECALVTFDDANYFNQDYTTNRTKLLNAIAALAPQNGTNYDAGLLLPTAGGLEVAKLGKHQKVIVFLTDCLPNFEPQTAAIIADGKLTKQSIF